MTGFVCCKTDISRELMMDNLQKMVTIQRIAKAKLSQALGVFQPLS
jgi:hypothetical protein